MSRLSLLTSAYLIAAASAAQAAPVKFTASRTGNDISLTCYDKNVACTRLEADLQYEDKDDPLPQTKLGPAFNFGFLEFDGKKGKGAPDGNFGITAKLAFRIMDLPQLFTVVARGIGTFAVNKDEITALTLQWDPTENVVIPGIGSFAFRFSNIGQTSTFAARDTNDANGSGSGASSTEDFLQVSATVEQVSVVPLPGGVVLLLSALGLIGIGAARRRATA